MLTNQDLSDITKLVKTVVNGEIESLLVQLMGVFKTFATKDDLKDTENRLGGRIDKVENRLGHVENRLNTVENNVREIKRDVWDIKADIVTHKEFNNMEKRTKRLEDIHQKELHSFA